jgi:hypothetical protein
MTLGVARGVLLFTQLDRDAQTALRAVHGVEVGIYELNATSSAPDRAAMLDAADQAMNSRGWERVVAVLDGDDMIGVFLPTKMTAANRMKCCVVVLDGRQLVVVSARADLGPVLECLRNKSDWRAKLPSLASR